MSIYGSPKAAAAAALFIVCVVAVLFESTAYAQFGVNLPRDDFTWVWGDREVPRRGSRDFSVNGSEGSFRCELTGSLRLGSRLDPGDVRQIENEIRSSLFFIQTSANMMNALDQRRELDWAILDCAKPEDDVDSEQAQERLERAREKAVREQAERRERREREEATRENP